jgi:hypothetical protein
MSFAKDLWFIEMDRKYMELLDSGIPDDVAYAMAQEAAELNMANRMADLVDEARMRAKYAKV